MEAGSFSITYEPEVLEQVRFSALEAFHALPRGGLEVGGMLYGRSTETGIEILDARPLPCEHLFGPGFLLSDNDMARFEELLRAPQRDRLLKGLQPVGWYRSASRSSGSLTGEDLTLHARLFPSGGGLILILRPERARPIRAQFYYLDQTGAWHSGGEFELLPARKPRRVSAAAPQIPSSPPAEQVSAPPEPPKSPSASTPAAASPQAPPLVPPANEEREISSPPRAMLSEAPHDRETSPRSSRPRWFWLVLAWVVALGSAGYAFRDLWLPKPPAPLQVGLYDLDGQLTIGWERSAEPLRGAQSGQLEILDGNAKISLPLSPDLLRKGTAVYSRQSGDVFVRLQAHLPGGKTLEGAARFSGPPPPSAVHAQAEAAAQQQLDELRATVEKQAARIRNLETANAALRRKLANSKR
ncbi:MAG: hypothetical protein ACUVXB_01845 [Bryobacteraceae bacterium]